MSCLALASLSLSLPQSTHMRVFNFQLIIGVESGDQLSVGSGGAHLIFFLVLLEELKRNMHFNQTHPIRVELVCN